MYIYILCEKYSVWNEVAFVWFSWKIRNFVFFNFKELKQKDIAIAYLAIKKLSCKYFIIILFFVV